MSDRTKIEWSDATWSPVTGCDRVSAGCDHCYALTMAKRLKGMGNPKYQNDGNPSTSGPGFGVTFHEDTLDLPASWRKPRRVFVNSMADLFHDDVADFDIARIWEVMARHPQHTFQILTKRHARMRSLVAGDLYDLMVRASTVLEHRFTWPLPNVWLGVSVEDQRWANIRIPALLATPAAIRFLSCEPLLGPVDLLQSINLEPFAAHHFEPGGIDWVIAGGESGPGARPMHPAWVRSLRDQCAGGDVPFLFKQWGEWGPTRADDPFTSRPVVRVGDRTMRRKGKRAAGRELDGRTWDQYPDSAA